MRRIKLSDKFHLPEVIKATEFMPELSQQELAVGTEDTCSNETRPPACRRSRLTQAYVCTAAGGTAAGDGDTTADSAGDGAADAAGNKDSSDEGDATRNEDGEYELFAVMIHQGTARGGHYYAYIKVVQLYIQSHARIHIRVPLTSPPSLLCHVLGSSSHPDRTSGSSSMTSM